VVEAHLSLVVVFIQTHEPMTYCVTTDLKQTYKRKCKHFYERDVVLRLATGRQNEN